MRYIGTLLAIIVSGCGSGVQSVCGIAYGQNSVGALVPANSVVALTEAGEPITDPGSAGYALVDSETWILVEGKFSSAKEPSCQFNVHNGAISK